MSEAKSSQGSQSVQTVLVIIVSVLITALFVLLWGNRGGGSQASSSSPSSSDTETSQELIGRILNDSAELSKRLESNDTELSLALAAKEKAVNANEGLIDQIAISKNQAKEAELKAAEGRAAINELSGANQKIIELENTNLANLKEIQELRLNDKSGALRTEVLDLRSKLANLKTELELAQSRLAAEVRSGENSDVLGGQLEAYKSENLVLQKQIADLRFQLNRSRLFVEESSSLNPRAAKLFASLKGLSNIHGEALSAAYTDIESDLGVEKIRHVKFGEGSSTITGLEEGRIQNDLSATEANSYFLVVGYASTKGSAEINRTLSAKRATATAAVVLKLKQAGQDVRAVYLGQTDRFSQNDTSANQLCEIWEIRE